MTMRIITNNVPRDIIYAHELTSAERADFDYLDWPAIDRGDDGHEFFRYRGSLYDLGDFMCWNGPAFSPIAQWDGYSSESFFSAIIVRFVNDGERVVVGLALS